MNLDDIDKLAQIKANYLQFTAQLDALPNMRSDGNLHMGRSNTLIAWHIVGAAVQVAARDAMQKHVDTLKAQLMLVGVTEFTP